MTEAAPAEIIPFSGVLRAVGTMMTAGCLVETWKDVSSSGKAYTRCRIVNDPPDLPDGAYILDFAGHSVPTGRVDGKWELVFLAPHLRTDHAA